jgi:AraC-like DNA-binding protein
VLAGRARAGARFGGFPFARPAHADDYALVYTERSAFIGGRVLTARFNATLLELPIRRDEAALASFLDGAPGRISMLYRRDRATVTRVRDLIRDALPASLSQDDVASQLHMSPRTLHRRLDEEGSSFRIIKEALRRDLALSRLTKTGHSIARVAADLGYADTSAFYRAFTGWTGMSPERYRRQLAGGPPPDSPGAAP